jgi:hypothetical protein
VGSLHPLIKATSVRANPYCNFFDESSHEIFRSARLNNQVLHVRPRLDPESSHSISSASYP